MLLSAFIILGFMPFAALSVHAEDDPNTIGELCDDEPRCGNGWMWDGRGTLTLFGAKIAADSYRVFSYDDGDITVELVGYNEVHTAGSTFAEVGGNTVTISGSGILNIDCPLGANVTVNSGYIESTVADDDLVNGFALTMNGGYVNAQSAAIGSLTMSKGYLDIGSITGNANVEGGYLKAGSVTANSTMSIQNCVVDIAGGVHGYF